MCYLKLNSSQTTDSIILQVELSRIKREIFKRPLLIIFDSTTHVYEAFVLPYLTDDWELKLCWVIEAS